MAATTRRPARRLLVVLSVPLVLLAACGSDKDSPSPTSPATTVVDAGQAPGPDGNSNNGGAENPGQTSVAATPTSRPANGEAPEGDVDGDTGSGGGGMTESSG